MEIELSHLDSERFGFVCARSSGWSDKGFANVRKFCLENSVRLLISRVDVDNTDASWRLQCEGAKLVDTLLYCEKNLLIGSLSPRLHLAEGLRIRRVKIEDKQQLFELGLSAFKSYFSHYHNDKLIGSSISDSIYADWCSKFAHSKEDNSVCYVLEFGREVVGLAGLKILGADNKWNGELFAISPKARGKKGFSALLDTSLLNAKEFGAQSFIYSTQIQNTNVLNALYRRGFYLSRTVNTFHLWFS